MASTTRLARVSLKPPATITLSRGAAQAHDVAVPGDVPGSSRAQLGSRRDEISSSPVTVGPQLRCPFGLAQAAGPGRTGTGHWGGQALTRRQSSAGCAGFWHTAAGGQIVLKATLLGRQPIMGPGPPLWAASGPGQVAVELPGHVALQDPDHLELAAPLGHAALHVSPSGFVGRHAGHDYDP